MPRILTEAELFAEARHYSEKYARYHGQRFGTLYTDEDKEDAAGAGYELVLAEYARGTQLNDVDLAKAVEARLSRIRRQRESIDDSVALDQVEAAEDDDEENLAQEDQMGGTEGARQDTRPARLKFTGQVRAEIARLFEAFEDNVYHAIRSGSLFRTQIVTVRRDVLRDAIFSFALRVAPIANPALPDDVRAWRNLPPLERQRQIEATRASYEGNEPRWSGSAAVIGGEAFRLARSVYWRDGNVNGFRPRSTREIRGALRQAEQRAREADAEGVLTHWGSGLLQRRILAGARRRRDPTRDGAQDATASVEEERVINEATIYARAASDIARIAGIAIDAPRVGAAMAQYRRTFLVLDCSICRPAGSSASGWLECSHNAPIFDDAGNQGRGSGL